MSIYRALQEKLCQIIPTLSAIPVILHSCENIDINFDKVFITEIGLKTIYNESCKCQISKTH